jgi:hypothetical protein
MDDIQESQPVAEGEYDLTIVNVLPKTSAKGEDQVVCTIEIEGAEDARPIRHVLTFPGSDREPGTAKFMWLNVKRFLAVFGIPMESTGFNTDDLEAATGKCLVVLDEPNDQGDQYNSLMLPRVKE